MTSRSPLAGRGRLAPRAAVSVVAASILVSVLVVVPASGSPDAQTSGPTPTSATEQRLNAIASKVNGLINKMTMAEKFGQLEMSGPTGPNGTPGTTLLDEVRKGTVGSVLDLVGVNNINQVQQAAMQSRLHIPVIFSLDVIHGYKTMFPVPLAEASSWDPATVANDESVSADEATADGIKWTFNPMVDISRDPRWGRVVEGAGEDPYLGSAIAAAKVTGYQGDDYRRRTRWRRPSSTSPPTAHRWPAVSTTPWTCPSSSCATTTSRRTRPRSTRARPA